MVIIKNKKIQKGLAIILSTVIISSFSGCGTDPAAQKVIDDISSIGEVNLDDSELILRIEKAYAALSEAQKNQVTNYVTLMEAREEIDQLIKEKAKLTGIEKSAYQAVIALKSSLKDPDSMKLISIKADTESSMESDSITVDYIFEIEYSAKNGFGGTGRETRYIATYKDIVQTKISETTLSIIFDDLQTIDISRIEAALDNPSLTQ